MDTNALSASQARSTVTAPARVASLPGAAAMPVAAPSPVAAPLLSGPAANRRDLVQAQARDTGGQVRERLLARVEDLVRGMEQLADRLASSAVSSSQRTVLMSRFTEMERQVNEIDGIVGSEGREASGRQALSTVARDAEGGEAGGGAAAAWGRRGELARRRGQVAAERQVAQRAVDVALRSVPETGRDAAAVAARSAAEAVRSNGPAATRIAMTGALVDLQV